MTSQGTESFPVWGWLRFKQCLAIRQGMLASGYFFSIHVPHIPAHFSRSFYLPFPFAANKWEEHGSSNQSTDSGLLPLWETSNNYFIFLSLLSLTCKGVMPILTFPKCLVWSLVCWVPQVPQEQFHDQVSTGNTGSGKEKDTSLRKNFTSCNVNLQHFQTYVATFFFPQWNIPLDMKGDIVQWLRTSTWERDWLRTSPVFATSLLCLLFTAV